MMDSRAYRTAVRSVLLVVPDPDAAEGQTQGIVALDKANAGTLNVPGLVYRIRSAHYVLAELDQATGELVDVPASCGVADWVGTIDGDARAVARAALTPAIVQAGGAGEWLRDYLRDNGETPRMDVIAAAGEDGYSRAAVTRAARALGVRSEQRKGQTAAGRPFRMAVWSLTRQSAHQSAHTDATEPPEPTGEVSDELIDS